MNLDPFLPPICEFPVKIIGIGDCGLHCLEVIGSEKLKDVDLVAINTNRRMLNQSPARTRILLGGGNGAGGNPELGQRFAEENVSSISMALSGAKTVMLLAGMGGGTGTGVSPVVARLAKDAKVIAVVSYPFSFEGAARQQIARSGISRLRENVDLLLVLENDHLLRFVERPPSILQVYGLVAKSAAWHVLACIL